MLKLLRVLALAASLAPGFALAANGLDLNTASAVELETLKGIGPVKAEAIVEYRKQNGPFRSVDELEKVPGIGAKVLEQIRDQVHVETPQTASR